MDQSSVLRLTLYGAVRCAGVGLLGGSLEALLLGFQSTTPLTVVDLLICSTVAVVAMAGLAFIGGVAAGLVSHTLLKRLVISRGLALQFALTVLAVVGFFFWSFSAEKWAENSVGAAIFLGGLPLLLFPVSFLLATPFFRRVEAGDKAKIGFLPVAAGGALLVIIGGVATSMGRYTGGNGALDSDPRFVIIAVDSLRGDLGGGATPNIDRLASGGVIFTDAIAAGPDTAPAVASALTGLPRVLRNEGYATAGFISSDGLSGSLGFSNGFYVYDDDLGSPIPGLFQLRLVGGLAHALGSVPNTRQARVTTDHFVSWLDQHKAVPFMALVHMQEPRAPLTPHDLPGFEANGTSVAPLVRHEGQLNKSDWSADEQRALRRTYQEEVAAVDIQVGRILDALDARGLSENTVVVLMGTGGQRQSGTFSHHGLSENIVNVPLILRIPGQHEDTSVGPSVRLHDLFITLLQHAEIEPRTKHEGISLLGYMEGRLQKSLWSPLTGHNAAGQPLIGARNNGIKYVRNLVTAEEHLYDLTDDPDERHDLTTDSPKTLQDARRLVASDSVRLGKLTQVKPAPVQ
ncbi:MAG: hypothetical protein ACI9MC_000852 [Kiritimatiellia bacterium]|jgi:hypothetical protein